MLWRLLLFVACFCSAVQNKVPAQNRAPVRKSACPLHSYPTSQPPPPESLGYRKGLSTRSATDARSYTGFALQAAVNPETFKSFRQVYYREKFAGIECDDVTCHNSQRNVDHVARQLSRLGENSFLQSAAECAQELDRIGDGVTQTLRLHGQTLKVSGLMLNYAGRLAEVQYHFGSLSGMHIVEIGVGFGGFAALLLRLHSVASYTLVDLPEVLNLAHRYLERARVNMSQVLFLNAAPCDNSKAASFKGRAQYDLALSMYAYAELPLSVRRAYFGALFQRSLRGLVLDNCDYKIRSAKDLLPQWIAAARMDVCRVLVYPDVLVGSVYIEDEAAVAWGAAQDYRPQLAGQVSHLLRTWRYHFVKLSVDNCTLHTRRLKTMPPAVPSNAFFEYVASAPAEGPS